MMRALVYGLVCGVGLLSIGGCSEESKTQKKETISTPGGKTTVTDEHKVNQSGQSPPKAP